MMNRTARYRARLEQYGREADAYYAGGEKLCVCGHRRNCHNLTEDYKGIACEETGCACKDYKAAPEQPKGDQQPEQVARLIKALKLSFVLQQAGADGPTAETMSVGQWMMAATAAKVKMPSAETKAMVIRMLKPDTIRVDLEAGPSNSGEPMRKAIAKKKARRAK